MLPTFKWYGNSPGVGGITEHMGDWLEGLSKKPQNIYPKVAIMLKSYPLNFLKVQSKSSKISNLGKFSFSLRIVPLIIHMNHFSYPLTIVQINIFEEPQNIIF